VEILVLTSEDADDCENLDREAVRQRLTVPLRYESLDRPER
jgi:hypothetical protein